MKFSFHGSGHSSSEGSEDTYSTRELRMVEKEVRRIGKTLGRKEKLRECVLFNDLSPHRG